MADDFRDRMVSPSGFFIFKNTEEVVDSVVFFVLRFASEIRCRCRGANSMLDKSIFVKNSAGKVVQLESFFILFPGMENGLRILFGGEVLKSMDEISGSLANLYLADPGLTAVHVGEEVLFLEPIRQGEAGKVVARVLLVTEKIICVYIEVWGGPLAKPNTFTRRYVGFGLCAIVDKQGKMIKNLETYRDPSELTQCAESVVAFQKNLRNSILKSL